MRFASFTVRFLGSAAVLYAGAAMAGWETPNNSTIQMVQQNNLPQPGVTTTVRDAFYKITPKEVGAAVSEQLASQGIEAKSEVTLAPGTPSVLYSSDRAVTISLHALQIDPTSKRWQGQVHFMVAGKTESVKPVAGIYTKLVEVPVVTRQLSKMDVIEKSDLTLLAVPERLLRKDAVTDPQQLIGQSPKNGISPNRPINSNEISAPIVVKRGELVEMAYNTPYIHIKTTGTALEDGAKGSTIRVKNQKSQLAVSARVDGAGRVSVNTP